MSLDIKNLVLGYEDKIIVNNIKSIIDLNDISNLDKLKLINNELGKILFDETI